MGLTRGDLITLGKENGLKGLSKLNISELKQKLEEAGVEYEIEEETPKEKSKSKSSKEKSSKEKSTKEKTKTIKSASSKTSKTTKTSSEKKTPTVRKDKLHTVVVNNLLGQLKNGSSDEKCSVDFKKFLEENKDKEISKEQILDLCSDVIREIITGAKLQDAIDLSNLVSGSENAINFLLNNKEKIEKDSFNDKLVFMIAFQAFNDHEKAHGKLIKAVIKEHTKASKPPAEKKKSVKKISPPSEDEDENEIHEEPTFSESEVEDKDVDEPEDADE